MSKTALKLSQAAAPNGELSPAQKRFNKLLRELESLRERIAIRTQQFEQDLLDYALHLAPAKKMEDLARLRFLLKLGGFWKEPIFLKKGDRSKLRDYILEHKDFMRSSSGTDLDAAFGELIAVLLEDWKMDAPPEKIEAHEMEEILSEVLDPSKLDPAFLEALDASQFTADMGAHEILEECKRQAKALGDRQAEPSTQTKQSRSKQKAAQKEAEMAEARDRTLGTIYKQLAKVLHPDLERDPSRQTEKLRLMQQVTEAYRNKDLFTLLRLEVEHLRKDEGDFAALTEEKLRIYVAVLKEQVELLKHEYATLIFQPRFTTIEYHVLSFDPYSPDWEALGQRARLTSAELDHSVTLLSSAPTTVRKELREVLLAFGDLLKQRAASGRPAFD